jgi:predicted Rossmann-fold nucleotide-binding protein
VDEEVKFPTLFQRLHYLVTFSDALVALRGGVGTLSEVALSWSLIQAGEMSRKPLVLVGPHWRQIMETYRRESTVKERDWAPLSFAADVREVVPLLKR